MNKPAISLTVDCLVSDEQWRTKLPNLENTCQNLINLVLGNSQLSLDPGQEVEVSVTLTNDAEIRELNDDHRDQDKATNVLSFPTYEAGELDCITELNLPAGMPLVLGDIIVALETMQREAELENKKLHDHFCHLIMHGCLHLLGFDHEEEAEAEEMEAFEIKLLKELGIANPYKSGL
jgi:probable rRNA maturation factor